MESCNYAQINNNVICQPYSFTLKLFLRQLLVSSGVWVTYFLLGVCLGAPTVYIPQIRKDVNSKIIITDEMASWLSSIVCFSGLPWSFILPGIMKKGGRKWTFAVTNISLAVGGIMFYVSTTTTEILVSASMYGVSLSAAHTVLPIMINEYSLPQYRGLFLSCKTMFLYVGIWVSNAIGTFFYWKNIGKVSMICSAYALVSVIFWPESPYWLSNKGHFDKCISTQRWLKGYNDESEKDLRILLNPKTERHDLNNRSNDVRLSYRIHDFLRIMRLEEFYKPVLLTGILMLLYHSSGKLVCSIYSIDIIKKITNSEAMAYKGMLILDGVVVLSMLVGSFLSKIVNRRTQLLSASMVGAAFLFVNSLYLFFIKINIITENHIISILLLTVYQLGISCGPVVLCSSIFGEMVPVKFISYAIFMTSFTCVALYGFSLKFAPYIIKKLDLHGTFLLYGIVVCICIHILYKYLPETKDKTIEEVQHHFSKHKVKDNKSTESENV